MRVLHVIPAVAARYGGPSRAAVGFCRGLEARGVRTLIAATNADGTGVLPVPTEVMTSFEGLDAIFFARRGEAFKYSGPLARWLQRSVPEFDAVHIHAVFSHSSLAAGRACRRHGVPYVLRPLGSLDPWALTRRAWKKKLLLGTAVRWLIDGAAAIHFMTEDERRLASPVAGRVPGAVVPPGVEDAYVAEPILPPGDRDRRVVALTRLHPVKRLDVLIRCFHAVASDPACASWRLTIAGDGEPGYREGLARLAASGPAAARIEFPGWLDGDEKRRWLRQSAVFALPSHQENFGLGLIEALACGVPAIVTTGVNLSPAVEEAGAGWVVGNDEAALVRALSNAMCDAAGRERRSHAARALASRFTWTETARQLEALYGSLRQARVESQV